MSPRYDVCSDVLHLRRGGCDVKCISVAGSGTAQSPVTFVPVTQVQKTYLRGSKVSVIEQPEEFVKAPCAFASSCGGCTLQQLPYALQVAAKTDRLSFELSKIAKLGNTEDVMLPVIPAQDPFQCDPASIKCQRVQFCRMRTGSHQNLVELTTPMCMQLPQ